MKPRWPQLQCIPGTKPPRRTGDPQKLPGGSAGVSHYQDSPRKSSAASQLGHHHVKHRLSGWASKPLRPSQGARLPPPLWLEEEILLPSRSRQSLRVPRPPWGSHLALVWPWLPQGPSAPSPGFLCCTFSHCPGLAILGPAGTSSFLINPLLDRGAASLDTQALA